MTNGERIRNMSDEEIAEFILESRSICKVCKMRNEECTGAFHECWDGICKWLKQEVKENE